uniref:Copinelike protein putative n=1 Tax=Albugo laibachii Nc14 TaxID=890382 RepID=F0W4Q9_9STRA|nr:copinelike protein putative [Albugo laibachii Nc14]|eukprot:CCA16094.1 copinelike protein putative [Albugo laibachii Nc14]
MGGSLSRPSLRKRRGSIDESNRRSSGLLVDASRRGNVSILPEQVASLSQVTLVLRQNGLGACNFILGIDFSKGNEWSGRRSYGGRCLHAPSSDFRQYNPYEQVLDPLCRALRVFGSRNAAPCYGFGDQVTTDSSVFTFLGGRDCILGLPYEGIQARYRGIVPHVVLSGPTSFAPIIHQSLAIVNETGEFHVLFIVATGHLTMSSEETHEELNVNEQKTIDAINLASHFPLSIVIVGVGDGPWDRIKQYKRFLHDRKFDNVHFVDYQKLAAKFTALCKRQAQFALDALMKLPEQYRAIKRLGYLEAGPFKFGFTVPEVDVCPLPQSGDQPEQEQGPPSPVPVTSSLCDGDTAFYRPSEPAIPSNELDESPIGKKTRTETSSFDTRRSSELLEELVYGVREDCIEPRASLTPEEELVKLQEELLCCICEEKRKNLVFQCGHETCDTCAVPLKECPTCRQPIQIRIKRFA